MDQNSASEALWSQLVRDLAHIKTLQRKAEAGDTEAEQEFWERARGMEVKLAIRRGIADADEDGEE